jgi:hypothetical protein
LALGLAQGFAGMSGNPNANSIMAGIQDQRKVLAARREKTNASEKLQSQTAMALQILSKEKFPMIHDALRAGIISPSDAVTAARKGSDARVVGSSLVAMDGTVLYTDSNTNNSETTALQTLKGRAKAAGLEEGTDAYRQFMLSAGKQNGLSLTVGPDGTVTLNQGGTGAASKPLSGNEGKATGFFMRANASNKVITELEETGTEFGQWVLGQIPLTNWARSPDFQRLDAAKRDWISAVLRLESGAAIAASEFDNYDKAYFPQVGDSAAVLSQKRTTRNLIAQTLKVQAGKGVSQTPVSASSSSPTVKVYDAQGNLISG